MKETQSQPLDAKSAHRLRRRQFTDLMEIWEGTTRNTPPRDFVFHEALALHDFDEVKYAVLTTMKKYCQLDGQLNINQLVGYFRGIIRRRAEKLAERQEAQNGSRASRAV
jgi:hypothetical protein